MDIFNVKNIVKPPKSEMFLNGEKLSQKKAREAKKKEMDGRNHQIALEKKAAKAKKLEMGKLFRQESKREMQETLRRLGVTYIRDRNFVKNIRKKIK